MTTTTTRGRVSHEPDVDPVRGLCHDMRQPLAAILALASPSPRDTADGDLLRRLGLISDQTRWLARLVDEVLVDAADDEVAALDVAACASLVVAASAATSSCRVSVEGSSPRCLARPTALTRALSCVVDNAVRAAGPDGAVAVTVDREAERVIVTVRDDGPGLGWVPERTSLGLALTRALIAACNGTFDLRPHPDGGMVARIGLAHAASSPVAS
ncbi:sensor histidine kinase [Nocardioides sp. Root151]|uniref:sensor histidine kinase n=1 Tax=Nocardioides sp. Root151 TaxID=1736475 RepID=UPI000AEBF024|nr:ATP-binding protein [Nocardioides sp. Root151]